MATPDEHTVCMGDKKIINFPTFDEAAAFASYMNGGAKPKPKPYPLLPPFLYRSLDDLTIRVGVHGDTDVTEAWEEYVAEYFK